MIFGRGAGELTSSRDREERLAAAAAWIDYAAPREKQEAAFCLLQEEFGEDPSDRAAALLLARSALFLSGLLDDPGLKSAVIRKGFEAAAAAGGEGDDPEAAYYFGTHLGMLIEEKGLSAAGETGRFERVLRQALVRPETEHGGPLRVLGMYYLRAPAWPLGAGDLEEALDYLGRAARDYPAYPENHLFFGYALEEDGQTGEAKSSLAEARRSLAAGDWGEYADRWRGKIDKFEEELR